MSTAQELMALIQTMKKTNPAEYEVFQKNYEKEVVEGVSFWGVNNGGDLTFWKLSKEVEDTFDCNEFGNKWCLGEDWGGLSSVSFRTITKKMVEYGSFEDRGEEDDSEDEDEDSDEDDDFEDCEDCGYSHHYEDKCPTGVRCGLYEQWRK
jgi:hypothetical protein